MTTTPAPTFDLMVRLERLAMGLEAEGFLGQAKLYRGLSRSLLISAAYNGELPRVGGALLDEMRQARTELEALGVGGPALAALAVAEAAATENRATMWDELGALHVCRLCGEMFLGETPAYCPTCGSEALAFWEVSPIYHLEPMTPKTVLDALATMPDTLRAATDGLTEAQMTATPAPGEWSIRETVSHLVMAQGVLVARTELLLTQEHPSLASQAVWTFKADETATTLDVVAQYEDVRHDLLATLRGIPYDAWLRSGWHTEFGEVTLLQQASYFAKHERYHLPQFAQIRAAVTQA